jgi:hypothetical protein
MIQVRGYDIEEDQQTWKSNGYFVHEHLLRDRSRYLANCIEWARSNGTEGKAIIDIAAYNSSIGCWVDWLYGQPFTTCEDGPEIMIAIAVFYSLADWLNDYECANFCLNAIRELLVEQSEGLGGSQWLNEILPVLESGRDEAIDMLVDTLAYGPWAESGELEEWLDDASADRGGSSKIWAEFFRKLSRAQAARLKAQTSENFDNIPDFMAEHSYRLREEGEELRCGREAPA